MIEHKFDAEKIRKNAERFDKKIFADKIKNFILRSLKKETKK